MSTLDHIARAARVTRGVVYWHFEGKEQIVHTLRERLSLPFLDRADTELLHGGARPPLERIERFLLGAFADVERDAQKRQALELMHFRVEYVDALAGELDGIVANNKALARAFEVAYGEAESAGALMAGVSPRLAAYDTVIFVTGLVRLWLLDASAGGFRRSTSELIRAHLQSRRRA